MHKVKMLKTIQGSLDGIFVTNFFAGKEYSLNDSLLNTFIEDGAVEFVAEAADEEKEDSPNIETAAIPPAGYNKRGRK